MKRVKSPLSPSSCVVGFACLLAAGACGGGQPATSQSADAGTGGDAADAADTGTGGAADAGDAGARDDAPTQEGAGVCSPAGWCWVNPTPQGDSLAGVWGTGADDVWAVGMGTVLHWNGSA